MRPCFYEYDTSGTLQPPTCDVRQLKCQGEQTSGQPRRAHHPSREEPLYTCRKTQAICEMHAWAALRLSAEAQCRF